MNINPNSTIILYSGMPLDSSYNDTLYFSSLSDQTSFFQANYVKRRFTANTYQRVNAGKFEAKCLADDIYDCNYMAFQNTNFGTKWFYAFIDKIEYINNGNALVTFTIDVLQTYLFDVELKECMVLREHPARDVIGGNIEPEPIALGEYTYEHVSPIPINSAALDVCVMWVDVINGTDVQGGLIDRTFSGANINAFRATTTGVQNALSFIMSKTNNLQKPEAIISIYMSPNIITGGTESSEGAAIAGAQGAVTKHTFTYTKWSDFDTKLLGYTVRNKKLFTYPYSYLYFFIADGGSMALRTEFFDGTTFDFIVYGCATPPIQLTLSPDNYKGNNYGNTPMLSEAVTNANWPLGSWAYDTYRAWLAQNTVPMALQGAQAAGAAVAQAATGNIIGAVGTIGSTAASMASEYYTASIKADTIRGNVQNGNAAFAAGYNDFFGCRAAVNIKQLNDIDDFFDLYGYAQNHKKVPSRANRPHWTYVQTQNCIIVGEAPADDLRAIRSIYDSGIRWWRNASEVGNFALDNTPDI